MSSHALDELDTQLRELCRGGLELRVDPHDHHLFRGRGYGLWLQRTRSGEIVARGWGPTLQQALDDLLTRCAMRPSR